MPTTRRYPRTLEQAFGPYARGNISEPYTPMHFADKAVVTVCCITLAGLVIAMLRGAL